jgi:hypothetical protein
MMARPVRKRGRRTAHAAREGDPTMVIGGGALLLIIIIILLILIF